MTRTLFVTAICAVIFVIASFSNRARLYAGEGSDNPVPEKNKEKTVSQTSTHNNPKNDEEPFVEKSSVAADSEVTDKSEANAAQTPAASDKPAAGEKAGLSVNTSVKTVDVTPPDAKTKMVKAPDTRDDFELSLDEAEKNPPKKCATVAVTDTGASRRRPLTAGEILLRLDRKMSVDFQKTTVEDAMAHLRGATGLNIIIGPDVDRKKEFSLTVNNMPVCKIMLWIKELTGYGYTYKNQAIFVSGKAESRLVMQTYPVRDLTMRMRNFYPPGSGEDDDDDDDDRESESDKRTKLIEAIKMVTGSGAAVR